jgi:uncharacterized protein
MDNLKIITCDPIIGLPRVPMPGLKPTVADLLGEMSRLQLQAAIVRHRSCIDNAPNFGNHSLMEDIASAPELIPAWVLTPDGCEPEFNIRRTVQTMLAQGVKVAWMYPKEHLFSVQPWCCGPLYEALQAVRVPLLVDFDQLTADDLHTVCAAFPQLRIILLNLPRLGRNRMIYPMLEQHPQLYICFGPSLSVHEGFADLCRRFGFARWVFGSGYPNAEGGSALTGLLYAGLPEPAVQAIAHENIERLLSDVRNEP